MAKQKKNPWLLPLVFVGFMLAGGVAGYGIGGWIKHNLKGIPVPEWFAILWLPFAIYLAILVHELGHALTGIALGMEFRLLAVGPLQIQRHFGQWTVEYNKSLSTWGGLAACIPADESFLETGKLKSILARFIAGGPVASLLGTLSFFLAKLVIPSQPYLGVALGEFGFISGSIALATLLPIGFGGYSSDGRRILDLVRNNDDATRWAALSVLGTLMQVRRTKDWPEEAVALATGHLAENADSVTAMWMRYMWHDARHEYQEAQHWLERALEARECWPKANQPMLDASAACFYALRVQDLARAKAHLEATAQPGFLQRELKLLAQAAVVALEGKHAETQRLLADLRPLRAKLPAHVQADLDEEVSAIERLLPAT